MPKSAGAGLTALLPLLPGADSDEDTAELELVRKRALSPGGQEGPNAKRQKVGSCCLTSAMLRELLKSAVPGARRWAPLWWFVRLFHIMLKGGVTMQSHWLYLPCPAGCSA